MPELPEVETTRRGLQDLIVGRSITACTVRNGQLRQAVPNNLNERLSNASIISLERRAKYLLLNTDRGSLLIHLGMSGSLRVVDPQLEPSKHDHVDIELEQRSVLRYRDPRRFGLIVWAGSNPYNHPLLQKLGPEPLQAAFDGDYLFRISRKRKTAIKQLIMDSHLLVGVGNIYANEALFLSQIRPGRRAASLSRAKCEALCAAIKQVLQKAIAAGGSSLRDFTQADGNPGYFQQQLQVYGREGENCVICDTPIKAKRIGQRSSFYCPQCQN